MIAKPRPTPGCSEYVIMATHPVIGTGGLRPILKGAKSMMKRCLTLDCGF